MACPKQKTLTFTVGVVEQFGSEPDHKRGILAKLQLRLIPNGTGELIAPGITQSEDFCLGMKKTFEYFKQRTSIANDCNVAWGLTAMGDHPGFIELIGGSITGAFLMGLAVLFADDGAETEDTLFPELQYVSDVQSLYKNVVFIFQVKEDGSIHEVDQGGLLDKLQALKQTGNESIAIIAQDLAESDIDTLDLTESAGGNRFQTSHLTIVRVNRRDGLQGVMDAWIEEKRSRPVDMYPTPDERIKMTVSEGDTGQLHIAISVEKGAENEYDNQFAQIRVCGEKSPPLLLERRSPAEDAWVVPYDFPRPFKAVNPKEEIALRILPKTGEVYPFAMLAVRLHAPEDTSGEPEMNLLSEFLGLVEPVVEFFGGFCTSKGPELRAIFISGFTYFRSARESAFAAAERIKNASGKKFPVSIGMTNGESPIHFVGTQKQLEINPFAPAYDQVAELLRATELSVVPTDQILVSEHLYDSYSEFPFESEAFESKLLRSGRAYKVMGPSQSEQRDVELVRQSEYRRISGALKYFQVSTGGKPLEIESALQRELDNGTFSDDLRRGLKDHVISWCSKNPTLSIEEPGQSWLIIDKDEEQEDERYYGIRKKEERLILVPKKMLFITGLDGSGKTSLINEAIDLLESDPLRVTLMSADPLESDPLRVPSMSADDSSSYWLLRQIICKAMKIKSCQEMTWVALEEEMKEHFPDIIQKEKEDILLGLGLLFQLDLAKRDDDEKRRGLRRLNLELLKLEEVRDGKIREAFKRYLTHRAHQLAKDGCPLVIILENAEKLTADQTSVALENLFPSVHEAPILIVIVARRCPKHRKPSPAAHALWETARTTYRPYFEAVDLGWLGSPQLVNITCDCLDVKQRDTLPSEVRKWIQANQGCLPLDMVETVKWWKKNQYIERNPKDGQWQVTETFNENEIPPRIREHIVTEYGLLDDQSKQVVTIASLLAVTRRDFSMSVLTDVCRNLDLIQDMGRLQNILESLSDYFLTKRGKRKFPQRLIPTTIQGEFDTHGSKVDQTRLYGKIAETIERHHQGSEVRQHASLAYFYAKSGNLTQAKDHLSAAMTRRKELEADASAHELWWRANRALMEQMPPLMTRTVQEESVMVVTPRVRGFICTSAHPGGCYHNVQNQVNYIQGKVPRKQSALNVLVIGSSGGYGLASWITLAWGYGAKSLGLFLERLAEGKRTATAGYYNAAAVLQLAQQDGLYADRINGDAFSDEVKQEAIDRIQQNMGKIDLLVYSLAAPRRKNPRTGTEHSSVLKPIGQPYTAKTIDLSKETLMTATIDPATEQEINDTVAVMGGEDLEFWVDALLAEGLLAGESTVVTFSYIGPEFMWPIYRTGTIGKAKEDLERRVDEIDKRLVEKVGGHAYVSVNKAIVSQASVAIPTVPVYMSLLFDIMDAKGINEEPIEQMARLFSAHLGPSQSPKLDAARRIRLDDRELRPDVVSEVIARYEQINAENFRELSDYGGVKRRFYTLFGFEIEGIDYDEPVETAVSLPSPTEAQDSKD